MAAEQTSRTQKKEVIILVAVAFATFWVFVFTRSMAAKEHHMETRIAGLWYEQGKQYIAGGKTEEAIQSFRNAAAGDRDNRKYVFALANALASGHHQAEAQQLLLRLRESDPENAEINTYLARLASKDQDISDAVRYYQNALYGRWNGTQVDERRRLLRIELIHLLLDHQNRDLASSELLILEADSPDTVSSHLETAKLFLASGDLQHALKNQIAALRLDGRNFQALSGASETSFKLGDYSKAREYAKAALEADPTSDEMRERLKLTDMVLDDDPLAAHLTAEERRDRLLVDFNRSLETLVACLAQVSNAHAATQLQSLKADALALEPTLNRRPPPDSDTIKSGLAEIQRIETSASSVCGKPAAPDQALILIGLEHNGAQR